MKNTFGSNVCLTIFGESHGPAVGAVLDGLPAGLPVEESFLASCMDKRRARGDGLSTARTEADIVHILSGVYHGRTTGTPITLEIQNQNTRSADYEKTAQLLRPGHADYTAYAKYHGWQDARGGGHFSGRITTGLTAAGAICLSALQAKGIFIATHLYRCAGIADTPFSGDVPQQLAQQVQQVQQCTGFPLIDPSVEAAMQSEIRKAGAEGDSTGGILETAIISLPAGVGEPFFDSVESSLAHMALSIPAVKGIEFGSGFAFADLLGSQANDTLRWENDHAVFATNHNGGINGGITNGMPILFRTAIKPTPSIFKPQQTISWPDGGNADLQLQGRHDPCIAPRAAIVQTCAAAVAVCDLLCVWNGSQWLRPDASIL